MREFIVWVEFELHDSASADFLKLVRDNARASLMHEIGCERFDVLISEREERHVALYEIYRDRGAFEDHMKTDHFRKFESQTSHLVRSKEVRTFFLT